MAMGRGGWRWKQLCKLVYETFGPVRHLCSHRIPGGLATGQVDHIVPVCAWPEGRFLLENLRPCHGGRFPCPECGNRCNQTRQARPVEYGRRKVLTPRPGYNPKPAVQREAPGRVW